MLTLDPSCEGAFARTELQRKFVALLFKCGIVQAVYICIADTLVQWRRRICSGLLNVELLDIYRCRVWPKTMPKGKAAIITGSTSGIGLGIARALAGAGCNVMLNGFGEPAAIERERTQIASEFGVRAAFNPADLAKSTEINHMVEATLREFGQIDIVVNNAGIQHTAPIERFPSDRWDAIIAINLSANFHTIRAALPHMRQRNWGRIVNIASTHGLVASVEKSAYVAAKHGVVGLTKVVALETATTGITCNAICPGWVLTPLVEKQIGDRALREKITVDQAKAELLSEKQPSHEFATPGQLGALAVFLCSDAAAQITGAALPVDGGWTAQ